MKDTESFYTYLEEKKQRNKRLVDFEMFIHSPLGQGLHRGTPSYHNCSFATAESVNKFVDIGQHSRVGVSSHGVGLGGEIVPSQVWSNNMASGFHQRPELISPDEPEVGEAMD